MWRRVADVFAKACGSIGAVGVLAFMAWGAVRTWKNEDHISSVMYACLTLGILGAVWHFMHVWAERTRGESPEYSAEVPPGHIAKLQPVCGVANMHLYADVAVETSPPVRSFRIARNANVTMAVRTVEGSGQAWASYAHPPILQQHYSVYVPRSCNGALTVGFVHGSNAPVRLRVRLRAVSDSFRRKEHPDVSFPTTIEVCKGNYL